MIKTLAMFNTEKELQCSRIIQKMDEDMKQSYLPDLYLQGLLMVTFMEVNGDQLICADSSIACAL